MWLCPNFPPFPPLGHVASYTVIDKITNGSFSHIQYFSFHRQKDHHTYIHTVYLMLEYLQFLYSTAYAPNVAHLADIYILRVS